MKTEEAEKRLKNIDEDIELVSANTIGIFLDEGEKPSDLLFFEMSKIMSHIELLIFRIKRIKARLEEKDETKKGE